MTGETTIQTELEEAFIISDLDTLKVVADPLRLSILEQLKKPRTVKEVAAKIERPATKLYYHFNLLEKHGLIQVAETRVVSGILEKHYYVVAKSYKVAPDLLSPGSADFDEGLELMLSGLFGAAREDLRESLLAGVTINSEDAPKHRRLLFTQYGLALTPEEAEGFYDRLMELIEDFLCDPEEREDTQTYKFLLLLHPSSRGGSSSAQESNEP